VVRALGTSLCLTLAAIGSPAFATDAGYFPLRVGNWWAYEEVDAHGARVSRETWTVLPSDAADPADEYHLRSYSKRLDALRGGRVDRFEGHEYLRAGVAGLQKRYPKGKGPALEVTLIKEPVARGTRWRDAQGECELISLGAPCDGPKGAVDDCAVVTCTLGSPPTTTVTSIYGRGVGMVRQELDVVQLVPAGATGMVCDNARNGHSVLRLTTYHVGAVSAAQRR
jgi:hypothetical protein